MSQRGLENKRSELPEHPISPFDNEHQLKEVYERTIKVINNSKMFLKRP